MVPQEIINKIHQKTEEKREDLIRFMREICAIPSYESLIGPVGERIAEEMRKLGFDEVRFDKMGNILGRIGDGPRTIVFDSHIDTVGIGDPDEWQWIPLKAKLRTASSPAVPATKKAPPWHGLRHVPLPVIWDC